MTLPELNERIKEEVVLHEGDLKEWQWRRNGLLTEAEQDGIAPVEFMRLVNDVSYQVGGLFPRINALKTKIETYARADKKQLTAAHTEEIVTEAERLTLTRTFVTQRWLPAILATIPDPPKNETPAAVFAPSAPVPVAPAAISREEVRRQIASRLDSYKGQSIIPGFVLRDLLQTVRADEAVLTEEIFTYLVSNLYKAVREPQGNSLRERLVSTDWQNVLHQQASQPQPTPVIAPTPVTSFTPEQPYVAPLPSRFPETPPVVRSFTATPARVFKGEPVTLEWEVENLLAVTIDDLGEGLSPKNRGWVKPAKTMEYTLFDVNNNPLSTVRVEVMRRDRSGVYGVLFALALLALIYWFVKSTNSAQKPYQEPERRTERASRSTKKSTGTSYKKRRREVAVAEPTPSPEKPVDKPVVTPPAKSKTDDAPAKPVKETTEPVEKKTAPAEPVTKPASPSDARLGKYEEAFGNKPYDKIELGTDERGWRRARSNGRWGFVNEDDEWVIQPEYEAVTPFRGNTAAVFLDGKLLKINREGEQIRN